MTARAFGFDGAACPDCGKPKSETVCCKAEAARLTETRTAALRAILVAKAGAR